VLADVNTRTFLTPGAVIAAAGTVPTICVAEIEVGVMLVPAKSMVSPVENPEPAIVSVNAAPPAVPDPGLNDVNEGPGPVTVKFRALETLRTSPSRRPETAGRPLGATGADSGSSVTVTGKEPAVAISGCGTVTVMVVAEVVSGVRVVVLKRTVAP
jgi:hypothetical protein